MWSNSCLGTWKNRSLLAFDEAAGANPGGNHCVSSDCPNVQNFPLSLYRPAGPDHPTPLAGDGFAQTVDVAADPRPQQFSTSIMPDRSTLTG